MSTVLSYDFNLILQSVCRGGVKIISKYELHCKIIVNIKLPVYVKSIYGANIYMEAIVA